MKYLKFSPFYLISFLPFWFLYLCSNLAFIIIYYVFKYRRKVVRINLLKSFPEKSEKAVVKIEKAFYQHFCDLAIESVKALTISKKSIKKRFHVANPELIEQLFQENKSIIMYTAHYGNWEWLIFLPLYIPFQVQTFYQKLSNGYFDEFMKTLRSRFGVWCVESMKGYKTMVKLNQDEILTLTCIIGDQSPRKDASKHWVNFLGQETAFLVGADRIAKKLNQAVLFASLKKVKRGYYSLEFIPIELNPAMNNSLEIIEKYSNSLQALISTSPELWLWSHRRWKLNKSI